MALDSKRLDAPGCPMTHTTSPEHSCCALKTEKPVDKKTKI